MNDKRAHTVRGSQSPGSGNVLDGLLSAMVAVGCFKDGRGQPVDDASPSYEERYGEYVDTVLQAARDVRDWYDSQSGMRPSVLDRLCTALNAEI